MNRAELIVAIVMLVTIVAVYGAIALMLWSERGNR